MNILTKQEKKFVKEVVEHGNKTLAVKEAFDIEDDNYAGVKGNRLIRKDKIQQAITSLAEAIPDSKVIQVLEEGLNAGKTIYKNNNSTGEIEEVGYEPDYAVRHKYLDSTLKIKGSYAPDKSINVNMNITSESREKAKELIKNYLGK